MWNQHVEIRQLSQKAIRQSQVVPRLDLSNDLTVWPAVEEREAWHNFSRYGEGIVTAVGGDLRRRSVAREHPERAHLQTGRQGRVEKVLVGALGQRGERSGFGASNRGHLVPGQRVYQEAGLAAEGRFPSRPLAPRRSIRVDICGLIQVRGR